MGEMLTAESATLGYDRGEKACGRWLLKGLSGSEPGFLQQALRAEGADMPGSMVAEKMGRLAGGCSLTRRADYEGCTAFMEKRPPSCTGR